MDLPTVLYCDLSLPPLHPSYDTQMEHDTKERHRQELAAAEAAAEAKEEATSTEADAGGNLSSDNKAQLSTSSVGEGGLVEDLSAMSVEDREQEKRNQKRAKAQRKRERQREKVIHISARTQPTATLVELKTFRLWTIVPSLLIFRAVSSCALPPSLLWHC